MNQNDNHMNILRDSIGECKTKMELVNDYLNRFKISDIRLVAPLLDVERCLNVVLHILSHDDNPDALDSKWRS